MAEHCAACPCKWAARLPMFSRFPNQHRAVSGDSGAAFSISCAISGGNPWRGSIFQSISGALGRPFAILPHSRPIAYRFFPPYSDRYRRAAVVYFWHTTDTHGGCDTDKPKKRDTEDRLSRPEIPTRQSSRTKKRIQNGSQKRSDTGFPKKEERAKASPKKNRQGHLPSATAPSQRAKACKRSRSNTNQCIWSRVSRTYKNAKKQRPDVTQANKAIPFAAVSTAHAPWITKSGGNFMNLPIVQKSVTRRGVVRAVAWFLVAVVMAGGATVRTTVLLACPAVTTWSTMPT